MKRVYESGIKQLSMIDMASIETRMRADKWKGKHQDSKTNKQKVVPVRDKCRFGSDVHSFIVLKHGRHTSKQDSYMDM